MGHLGWRQLEVTLTLTFDVHVILLWLGNDNSFVGYMPLSLRAFSHHSEPHLGCKWYHYNRTFPIMLFFANMGQNRLFFISYPCFFNQFMLHPWSHFYHSPCIAIPQWNLCSIKDTCGRQVCYFFGDCHQLCPWSGCPPLLSGDPFTNTY